MNELIVQVSSQGRVSAACLEAYQCVADWLTTGGQASVSDSYPPNEGAQLLQFISATATDFLRHANQFLSSSRVGGGETRGCNLVKSRRMIEQSKYATTR